MARGPLQEILTNLPLDGENVARGPLQEILTNLPLDGENVARGQQLAAPMPSPPPLKSLDWSRVSMTKYLMLLIAKLKTVCTTGVV